MLQPITRVAPALRPGRPPVPNRAVQINLSASMQGIVEPRCNAAALHVQGAAEMVLSRCVAMIDSTGRALPMTEQLQSELLATVTEMASRGLRTLCLAYTGGRPCCIGPHGLEHGVLPMVPFNFAEHMMCSAGMASCCCCPVSASAPAP